MVLVWMTTEVSPRCIYSDLVVMVRVRLQLDNAAHARTEMKIRFCIKVC